jgi:hypothetical protein
VKDNRHLQLLHLPFNPGDPTSKAIHAIFTDVLLNGNPLTARDSTILALPKLTICYHRQKTLGSILNPSDITNTSGITPQAYLATAHSCHTEATQTVSDCPPFQGGAPQPSISPARRLSLTPSPCPLPYNLTRELSLLIPNFAQ